MLEGEYLYNERNGKFKEYTEGGKLLSEQEYINGKRNGKCKIYNFEGELKFEGEYLYDHKKYGKKYIDGILEYEGEYLFDKKWNGKGYNKNGNVINELINGTGKVKEYAHNNNLVFEGEYLNGKKMEKL